MTFSDLKAPRRADTTYGEAMTGVMANGRRFRAGVFNEHEVRAAAGLAMVLGAIGFAYAYFARIYLPIRYIAVIILIDFLIRVLAGLQYSPTGIMGRWMTSRRAPEWVSAKPKRFAWTLGLMMVTPMAIGMNMGLRGAVPLTICAVCMTFMWLEAVLGLCVGCGIHRLLVRRGWAGADEEFEVCTHGNCSVQPPGRAGS